jgi:hypothetical protein
MEIYQNRLGHLTVKGEQTRKTGVVEVTFKSTLAAEIDILNGIKMISIPAK